VSLRVSFRVALREHLQYRYAIAGRKIAGVRVGFALLPRRYIGRIGASDSQTDVDMTGSEIEQLSARE
jgi:hypothetical protein